MSDVRWEGLTHAEIYAQVQQGPGRTASADAEAAWTTVRDTIRAVNEQLTRAVRQIGAEWRGRAADSAHGGMTAMNDWALDAVGNATLTTDGIAAQAGGAQRVRDAMPPPRPHLDAAVALAGAAGYAPRATNAGAIEDQMAEDRAMAVDLMNRYTRDSSTHQELMNYWTQPPSVVVETVAPQSPSGRHEVATGASAGLAAAGVAAGARPAGAGAVPQGGTPPNAAGSAVRAGPVVGRAGAPGPATVPTTSGGGGAAPPDRPTGPAPLPATPFPSPGSPGSRGRPPNTELPSGGVRRVVPGVPARPGTGAPGDLDAPWRSSVGEPVPRTSGLPEGPLRADTGGRAVIGDPTQDVIAGRPGGPAGERFGPGQGTSGSGHGILPLGSGAVGRAANQEHRRAGYLVDDTDAFADDRWFTPAVIGADDLPVRRT